MSDTLPVIGQEPWGEDLNAYLAALDGRIDANEEAIATNTARITNNTTLIAGQTTQIQDLAAQVNSHGMNIAMLTSSISVQAGQIADLTTQVTTLTGRVNTLTTQNADQEARILALEAQPEYIWGNAAYQFATQMPPATGSQVRMNNADPKLATMLDFRRVDADGYDRTQAFDLVTPQTLIRLSDSNNGAVWYRFKATGKATHPTADNFNIPVAYYSSAGTLGGTKVLVGMLVVVPLQSPIEVNPLEEPAP